MAVAVVAGAAVVGAVPVMTRPAVTRARELGDRAEQDQRQLADLPAPPAPAASPTSLHIREVGGERRVRGQGTAARQAAGRPPQRCTEGMAATATSALRWTLPNRSFPEGRSNGQLLTRWSTPSLVTGETGPVV